MEKQIQNIVNKSYYYYYTYGEIVSGVSAQREQTPAVNWHHAL